MISKNHLPTALLLFVYGSAAMAIGGGSVVGNGAGLVENNFQYAYLNLGSQIKECLETAKCETTAREQKLLAKIQLVLTHNKNNAKRLQFVSESEHPGFFSTGLHETNRLAKTGLDAKTPIFVNADLLYDQDGKPAVDFPTIHSILLHELGHQTGEENHALLDILGSKIKKVLNEKVRTFPLVIGENKARIEITLLTQTYPFLTTDLSVTWARKGTRHLTEEILQNLSCTNPEDSIAGFEMDNGHYTFIPDADRREVGFGVWVHLSCFSKHDLTSKTEMKSVELVISPDFSIRIIRDEK